MAYNLPKDSIIHLSKVQPKPEPKSTRELALEECCANYENAIKASQSECKRYIKEAHTASKQIEKLIRIVTHNIKNSAAILKQLK